MRRMACKRLCARAVLAVFALLCGLFLFPRPSFAHELNVSRGDFRRADGGAEAWIALSRADLVVAVPELDANGDKTLAPEELVLSEAAAARLTSLLTAKRGDVACKAEVFELGPHEEDGGYFSMRFGSCEGGADLITIELGKLVTSMGIGHRLTGFVHVPGEQQPRGVVVHGADARVEVPVDEAAAPPAKASAWPVAKECFVLGLEHIAFGIDHVVFLVGLVLLGGRWRDLAATVTAFTLAHSVTLGLTVVGVVAPKSSLVEPLIALSVAYVGIENFFAKDITKRWRIAGAFGLIHGFGFAGAVADKLPRDSLPVALSTFNVGVEVGQLLILVVLVPLLTMLRKREWFKVRGVQVVSGLVAAAGVFWFVERVI